NRAPPEAEPEAQVGSKVPENVEVIALAPKHMKGVLAVERKTAHPDDRWGPEELETAGRGATAWALTEGDKVLGYVVFRQHDTHIEILKFAVDPAYRVADVVKPAADLIASKHLVGQRNRAFMDVRTADAAQKAVLAAAGLKQDEGFRLVKQRQAGSPLDDW